MTPLHKPVTRLSIGSLDGSFGRDRNRRLVATLDAGDILTLRPMGTRRAESVALMDIYRFAIRSRVNKELLEKARERKARAESARRDRELARAIHR